MKISPAATRVLALGLAAALTTGGSLLAAAPALAAAPVTTLVSVDTPLTPGTVTIDDTTPEVGDVLTAVTDGWPVGTTFTYEWFYSGGNFGGPISDQTGVDEFDQTYTIDPELIGLNIGVIVTGSLIGFTDGDARDLLETVAFTAVKPAAAAPVADSTGVAAYLETNGAYIQTQAEAGLPAGALNPATPVTATVFWGPGDSFVDVYAYSAPTFVGTVAVVDGVASVALSAEVLAALGAGTHTLVAVGQTSGNVGAVTFEVSAALAATGAVINPVAPIAGAGVLLLLGAALIVLRRRRTNA